EGTLYDKGYKTLVGGDTFDDFSKHPNIYNKKLNSTAAGAYQILKKLGITLRNIEISMVLMIFLQKIKINRA
ncbi:glycoside hydrolase family 104 protein, partial [Helicobacter cinaedi]